MTRIRRIWKDMSFWNKIERAFGLIGGITVTELGINSADPKYFIWIGVAGVIGKLIHIFFEDIDGNGIVDLFQDENK